VRKYSEKKIDAYCHSFKQLYLLVVLIAVDISLGLNGNPVYVE